MDTSNQITKQDLENAFAKQEFVLYYQPQFNLTSSTFEGVEALVRWKHPNGLLLPDDFLKVLEEKGMISRLGEWVLETVCKQNKEWEKKGLFPVRIAVNIYNEHFQQSNFVDVVLSVLEKYKIDPRLLELELSENLIIHAHDTVAYENIKRLRVEGIKIALDDFGTGFSSISHLKRITVDRIKIDKSYIKNIHLNKDDATIVKAIIALAEGLDLQSLAEGVESQNQLQVLMKYECHEAQGFYFSEPLTAQETEEFLLLYRQNPFIFNHP